MRSLTEYFIFQGDKNPQTAKKVFERRGRPKKDVIRDQIIRIRLTPVEHEQIHKFAESEEITVSEFIRNAVNAYTANGGRRNL